jgi:hypothetical protein
MSGEEAAYTNISPIFSKENKLMMLLSFNSTMMVEKDSDKRKIKKIHFEFAINMLINLV